MHIFRVYIIRDSIPSANLHTDQYWQKHCRSSAAIIASMTECSKIASISDFEVHDLFDVHAMGLWD